MKKCFICCSLTKTTLAMVAAAVALLAVAPARANTGWVSGGNWAATGGLVTNIIMLPDGMNIGETTNQAIALADTIANDYISAGINFVRFPINPATVSDSRQWPADQAAINELVADGLYVDLCCWYIDDVGGSGLIPNMTTWQSMWQTVDGVYGNNNMVYYEPINEPYGYSLSGLEGVYTTFLGFIGKSQDHILLGGTGYEDNVTGIGADSSFNNCLLAVHSYSGWANHTTDAAWSTVLYNQVHPYQDRTIMTEMGAPTTTGLNYNTANSGNNDICFVRGMCNQCVSWGGMGAVWFPADQNDSANNKRMFNGPGQGIINQSLVNEMQYGWHPLSVSTVCDFNTAGVTDFSLFRPSSSSWEIKSGGGGVWGTTGDIAVPADYAGNGKVQMATWRPSNDTWYLDGVSGGGVYGTAGDIPAPADYAGTGKAQCAVFRPSNGNWYILNGPVGGHFGTNGDIPVPGYYNGDGHADIAVYRPSNNTWYIKGGATVQFGLPGDIPVPGDYNGSGKTQIAVWRPSTGEWIVQNGLDVQWGQSGDVPVPGDYAGTGITQLAIWRPSNNGWYVKGVAGATWGTTGDVPLPLPYAIRHYALGYTQ